MQSFKPNQAVEFCRNGVWVQGEYLYLDTMDRSHCVVVKGEGIRWIPNEYLRAVESSAEKCSKTLSKYAFKMFDMDGLTDPEAFLNEKGAEGWRLAAIDYGCFIMEKEVQ